MNRLLAPLNGNWLAQILGSPKLTLALLQRRSGKSADPPLKHAPVARKLAAERPTQLRRLSLREEAASCIG